MKLILLCLTLSFVFNSSLRNKVKQCPCDANGCPSCMLANTLKTNIEEAEQANLEDAAQQRKFIEISELQNKLFTEAQKYAEAASQYETNAQNLAKQLQEQANKAQEARNTFQNIEKQAKSLALKTLNTNLVHKPLFNNLQVVPVGIKTKQIIHEVPEYQVGIQAHDQAGEAFDD